MLEKTVNGISAHLEAYHSISVMRGWRLLSVSEPEAPE